MRVAVLALLAGLVVLCGVLEIRSQLAHSLEQCLLQEAERQAARGDGRAAARARELAVACRRDRSAAGASAAAACAQGARAPAVSQGARGGPSGARPEP